MFLYALILTLHVVVSVALVVSVLLQSSKGGGLAGTFGGSGVTGGVFGGRGAAPFLTKATTVLAIMFMVTSISLNMVGKKESDSALQRAIEQSGGVGSAPAVTTEMPTAPATDEATTGSESSGNSEQEGGQ